MRTLHSLQVDVTTGVVVVPCPVGTRCRIMAIDCDVTPGADGDQLIVQFAQSSNQVAMVASNPVLASVDEICGAIGAGLTASLVEASMDVATGVITFNPVPLKDTFALPDIWFDWEVTVTISTVAGNINGARVLYESDATPPRARARARA